MNHPLFICQNIAEELRDPKKVEKIAQTSMNQIRGPSSLWLNSSFSDGFTGISYFYSAMDEAFPDEKWNDVAQKYIVEALNGLQEHKSVNSSLFKGLVGISLAMSSIRNTSYKFQQFHEGIDNWLIEDVRGTFLKVTPQFLDESTFIPPFLYCFPVGLSGIISYLLTRKNNPYLQQLAQHCSDDLAKMMLSKKKAGSEQVHAWYFTQDQLAEVYRTPNIEGGYDSSMFQGVTGCLIALSSAVIEGIASDNIYKAIQLIAYWLKDTYQYIFQDCYWNSTISIDGTVNAPSPKHQDLQHSWLKGWPALAKSLFIAGKALREDSLLQFSKNLCNKFVEKKPTFFLEATSFCLGMSGYISTLYSLAKETNNSTLLRSIQNLSRECSDLYDPNVVFRFRQRSMNENEIPFLVESPTLGSGSAGIGLSFLVTEDKISPPFFI